MYGRPQGLQLRLLRGEVMSPFKAKKLGFLAVGITALALFAAQGCSSGDDSQASPPAGGAGGSHAGATGKSGSGNSQAGTTNSNGGSGNTGNTGNDNAGAGGAVDNNDEAGAGGEAGAPVVPPGCVDATGCYSCAPQTNDQFLNACVAGGCPAHFDNTTLTKLNLVGTL
jgi:hypothetical protein